MAKSQHEIDIDYERAIEQAERLEEVARNMYDISNKKLEESLQTISNNWKGESAGKFGKKGIVLQGNIRNSSREIEDIANEIRRIAKAMKRADEAAMRIAEERVY